MRISIILSVAAVLAMLMQGIAPAGAGEATPRTPDNDNDAGTATPMASGQFYLGNLSSTDDTVDFFSAQAANPGQAFNITVAVMSWPTMKLRLVAYDPQQNLLDESNSGGAWESLSFLAVKLNAKYYFAVYITTGASGNYAVNCNLETPAAIAWTNTVGGSLGRNGDNPVDWYTFPMNAGGANDLAQFTITHDAGVTIDAYIFGLWPDYLQLTFNASLNHTTGRMLVAEAAYTGAYYLKVWASSGFGGYSVTLAANNMQEGDNDYDAPHAHRLNNTAATGWLDSAYDHYAYYGFYLAQGEVMKVKMTLTFGVPGKFSIYLFAIINNNYVLLASSSNYAQATGWSNVVNLTWNPDAGNRYYVVPMADEAHDAQGRITSGASNASFILKLEAPDPINHAPIIASSPGVPSIPEDVETKVFSLYDIFQEPDGDPLYLSARGSPNITVRLEFDGSLFLKGAPDWSGIAPIQICATDTYGLFTDVNVPVQVTPVDDPPVVIRKFPDQTLPEDSIIQVDLDGYFYDADIENKSPQDYLTYNISGTAPVLASINGTIMTLGPFRGWVGTLTTPAIRAQDNDGAPVHRLTQKFNLTVTHVNHPPYLSGAQILIVTLYENGVDSSNNVKNFFNDPDISYAGDVLRYRGVSSPNVNCTILPDGSIEVRPAKNWNGEDMVYATATDLGNATCTLNITVIVQAVNQPPEITFWMPETAEFIIMETETLNLSVVVTDVDTNLSALTYAWFVDGNRVLGANGPQYSFVTDYNSSRGKAYTISVNVSDGAFNVTHTWTIPVQDKNRLPVVNIVSPAEAGTYPAGQMLLLRAEASDPEFDPLTYSWKEGNTTLGNTRSLNWKFSPGNHTVTVLVGDGTGTTRQNVTFFMDSNPVISITAPEDRKHFKTSDKIKFTSQAYDPDGSQVTVEWRDGTKVLSRSADFSTKLSQGFHDIALNVTDGRNFVETRITVIVDAEAGKGPIPGFGVVTFLAAALAAAAVLVFGASKRGKRPLK